jgi:hypothetical protein
MRYAYGLVSDPFFQDDALAYSLSRVGTRAYDLSMEALDQTQPWEWLFESGL